MRRHHRHEKKKFSLKGTESKIQDPLRRLMLIAEVHGRVYSRRRGEERGGKRKEERRKEERGEKRREETRGEKRRREERGVRRYCS